MRTPTTEKLALALEALDDPKLSEMIRNARAGFYDDYKTTIPQPIARLIKDLSSAGYPEMAERAMDGEWNAQKWEADEWFEHEGKYLITSALIPGEKKGG